LACAPTKAPPAPFTEEELGEPPQLPSPYAGSYARVLGQPKDVVVLSVLGSRAWEASLSGTAAGLALDAAEDRGGLTRRNLREAAWQAGYPWPILAVATWPTSEGGRPPTDIAGWIRNQPPERDIGLVRARGRGKDVWVALAAQPLLDLGVVPKEMARGQVVRLPVRANTRWRVSDGLGALSEGTLDQNVDLTMSSPGEWIVQILDDGGDLARFPLYVEQKPPRFRSDLPAPERDCIVGFAVSREIAVSLKSADSSGNTKPGDRASDVRRVLPASRAHLTPALCEDGR
jgi:hypothetical protein